MTTQQRSPAGGSASWVRDLVIARQPILDRDLKPLGFELLYRPIGGHGRPLDPERATATVLSTALGDIGLEALVGGSLAFVNVTRQFLLDVDPLPLPADRVVLELVEDELIDAPLLAVLNRLVGSGFSLALDDFVYRPQLDRVVELATFVKVDVQALEPAELAAHAERFRGSRITLVAEKVESSDEFEHCRDLGFDAFQGYFFARPELVHLQRTPTFRLDTVRTLASTEDDAFDALEKLISCDVGLSHKLLRLANSAHVAPRSRIRSIRHALSLLGVRTVRRWVMMLALADGRSEFDQILLTALLRARMCELIARRRRDADHDRAFTVGLFSVADGLVGQPLPELLESLPFDDRLTAALLEHEGPEGDVLTAVMAYERGFFDAAASPERDLPALAHDYYDALEWAYDVIVALS